MWLLFGLLLSFVVWISVRVQRDDFNRDRELRMMTDEQREDARAAQCVEILEYLKWKTWSEMSVANRQAKVGCETLLSKRNRRNRKNGGR